MTWLTCGKTTPPHLTTARVRMKPDQSGSGSLILSRFTGVPVDCCEPHFLVTIVSSPELGHLLLGDLEQNLK